MNRDAFERDGYFVVEGALSEPEVDGLRQAARRIASEHDVEAAKTVFRTDDRDRGRDEAFLESARGIHGFLEAEALDENEELVVGRDRCFNKIGHALHDFVPEIGALARSSMVREAFRAAGHEQTLVVQTMYIFKPPRIGGEVRWHQDASYLHTDPSSVVGIWFALEDADRDNGCLWVAPGGHRSPLREEYLVDWTTRVGELRPLEPVPWPENAVPLEVSAGTAVVFHDHLPHRSDPNRSDRSRVALTLHGHDVRSDWLTCNWLQRAPLGPFVI